MGRLREDVIDKIKHLVAVGYANFEIVREVGVTRQTVAKYRRLVEEEERAREAACARARQEELEQEIHEAEARTEIERLWILSQVQARKAQEEERLQRVEEEKRWELRRRRQLREEQNVLKLMRQVEEENKNKALKEGMSFLKKYISLYGLKLKSIGNEKQHEFNKILDDGFGYPWNRFVYSEEELKALPYMLRDRQNMDLLLSLNRWPFSN